MTLFVALTAIANADAPKSNAVSAPTFYAPKADYATVLPSIAVIFGGLHCIGWNSHFLTRTEQLLWRAGSLVITLVPSVLLVFITRSRLLSYGLKTIYLPPLPGCVEVWRSLGLCQ